MLSRTAKANFICPTFLMDATGCTSGVKARGRRMHSPRTKSGAQEQVRSRLRCAHAGKPRLSSATVISERQTMKIEKMLKSYRIEEGRHFRLKDHDPDDTYGLKSEGKPLAQEWLARGVEEL